MTKTALVFPGQGSQSIGMLGEIADRDPLVIEYFDLVSNRLGYDLWDLVQHGPEAKLNQTEHTQVAMLVADVALFQLMQSQGSVLLPSLMAGHSLGEYAALVCADALDLSDAVLLVQQRGQLMQDTVPLGEGAMAAIVGLSDELVQEVCRESSTITHQVSPANYNAIGQVVIAGHTSAVERALQIAEDRGARLAKLIPVSVPCHCMLLREAANQFGEVLENTSFSVPSVPVISNVDLSTYSSVEQIKKLLRQQLYSPVRWVDIIQFMKAQGVEQIIECGPGTVLSGLIKRIDKSIQVMNVQHILK